jgi:hypothetical protein
MSEYATGKTGKPIPIGHTFREPWQNDEIRS